MIINLVTFKVIAELDDMLGYFYLKMIVLVTDDGAVLENLMDYEELETKDLRAVSYWCFFMMYLYFSHIVLNIVRDVYPNHFLDVSGEGWSNLFGLTNYKRFGFSPKMHFIEAMYYLFSIPVLNFI